MCLNRLILWLIESPFWINLNWRAVTSLIPVVAISILRNQLPLYGSKHKFLSMKLTCVCVLIWITIFELRLTFCSLTSNFSRTVPWLIVGNSGSPASCDHLTYKLFPSQVCCVKWMWPYTLWHNILQIMRNLNINFTTRLFSRALDCMGNSLLPT